MNTTISERVVRFAVVLRRVALLKFFTSLTTLNAFTSIRNGLSRQSRLFGSAPA
jgi:hypothetical protein